MDQLVKHLENVQHELDEALQLAKLGDDVADMTAWVNERAARLEQQTKLTAQSLSFDEKLDYLKKHQALEIELSAHRPRVKAIRDQLESLRRHAGARSKSLAETRTGVLEHGHLLMTTWEELQSLSSSLTAALREAKDLFDFNQSVRRVLEWIHEKQLMLTARDMGRDREHCQSLLDRLIGKAADQSIDDATLRQVNTLGAKLIAGGSSDTVRMEIQSKLREMNEE